MNDYFRKTSLFQRAAYNLRMLSYRVCEKDPRINILKISVTSIDNFPRHKFAIMDKGQIEYSRYPLTGLMSCTNNYNGFPNICTFKCYFQKFSLLYIAVT